MLSESQQGNVSHDSENSRGSDPILAQAFCVKLGVWVFLFMSGLNAAFTKESEKADPTADRMWIRT